MHSYRIICETDNIPVGKITKKQSEGVHFC